MQVQCSKCGHRSRKVKHGYYEARGIANAGWRSYGSALYCPKCTKIINRKENKDAAIMTIMERMINDAEQEIEILKGEYQP